MRLWPRCWTASSSCSAARGRRGTVEKSSRTAQAPLYQKRCWAAVPKLGENARQGPTPNDEADRTKTRNRAHQRDEGTLATAQEPDHALSGPGRLLRARLLMSICGRDLSFTIQQGPDAEPCGRSGCGKSTAGRSILRCRTPVGEVTLTAKDIHGTGIRVALTRRGWTCR